MNDDRINRLRPHPAQSGLLAAWAGNRPRINSTCAYQITGSLDAAQLAHAYERALQEFDALRLTWPAPGNHGGWAITDAPRARVRRADLRGEYLTTEQAAEDLLPRLQEHSRTSFDLSRGPLGRVDIWQVGTRTWVVAETFDHAVADGRSLSLLHDAVTSLYRDPARTPPRYPSYAAALTSGPPGSGSLGYWKDAFDGFEATPLPAPPPGGIAADWQLTLTAERINRLEHAAGRFRGTLASALLTAHAHAVARHSGTGDIATYLAVDTRTADHLDVFGQMTAVLPLRVRHDWSSGLGRQVSAMTRAMLRMREHLDADIDALDDLHVPVSLSRPDATAFVMQPYGTAPDLPGAVTTVLPLRSEDQAGGLATVARHQPDGSVRLSLRAAPGSHLASMITSIGDTLDTTLEAISSRPDTAIGSDTLLPARHRPLIEATATPSAHYPFRPLAADIIARLSTLGNREILVADRAYSADDLLRRILETAGRMQDAGTREGDTVIAGGQPLADRIAAFAATLHIGAVYMPFDSDSLSPADHSRHPGATLIDASGVRRCPGPRVTAHGTGPQAPAYVIFTSGSSGTPKGVVVSRAALSNLIRGEADRFGICASSRVLLVAPAATDPWICHVAAALTFGATLVNCPATSGPPLGQQMRAGRITHAFLPAALLRTLDTRDLPDLQMIATAGDTCRAADLTGLGNARVFNIYGPTEATVTATVAEISDPADPVPLGRPIRGLGARIVIDRAASAPPGAPGELMISGAGVADGYLDDEERTRASFRADPFSPGQRAYWTGDLARLEADGQLVHLGRIDRQVKVRGTRVEPEALEAAARATGLCADARVKAYRSPASPDTLLVLFAEGCPDTGALRKALRGRIPAAAWPHHIAAIDTLPRRASGKVADELLPADYAHALSNARAKIPRGAAALSRIWAGVLGATPRPDDRFFDMGGDSLNVLRLVRLARAAGIDLDPADVYAHPEFSDLDRLCGARRRRISAAPAGTAAGQIPLGPAQEWLLAMAPQDLRPWIQRHVISFPQLPGPDRLHDALATLIAATPILRTSLGAEDQRFTLMPAGPARVGTTSADASDEALASQIDVLAREIDPSSGAMLSALAVRGEPGSGAIVLVAHHLVVDIWSWSVIEDRLRLILGARPGTSRPLPPDHGFALFAQAVARQKDAGAFDLEAGLWKQVLGAGDTAELAGRPGATERTARGITEPERLAGRRSVPPSRILLAALGEALHVAYGAGTTVVDVERNGRTSISGLDLSSSAGWIGLHHPVALAHAPLTPDAIQHVLEGIDDVPDFGLGYGALRWSGRADLGDQVGRFAVNVSGSRAPQGHDGSLERRISALEAPGTTARHLPYHGTFTFHQGGEGLSVSLDFDPARVSRGQAEHLLEAIADATQGSRPRQARGRAVKRRSPFSCASVPASATQRLMLHYAGSTPGAYLPRQVLAIDGIDDPDRFLDTARRFLGLLDPFRRRFQIDTDGIAQTWLPARPIPVCRSAGGRQAALAWVDSDDRISSEAVLDGKSLAQLTAFCEGTTVFLGMEVHHALMDGVSNSCVLALIDQLARQFPGRVPAVPAHHALSSRTVLRKHVACEMAAGPHPEDPELAAAAAAGPPVVRVAEIPPDWMRRISGWAADREADLRAALGAVTARAAQETLGARAMYAVANGRDADIPGSADALGMFWYFQEIPITHGETAALAKAIHQAAAVPLSHVRSAALRWPGWDASAVAFNFTKQDISSGQASRVHVIRSRDVFHFATQVSAVARTDGSGLLTCTATRMTMSLPLLHERITELFGEIATMRR